MKGHEPWDCGCGCPSEAAHFAALNSAAPQGGKKHHGAPEKPKAFGFFDVPWWFFIFVGYLMLKACNHGYHP
jgi:hypothetical protein